MEIFLRNAIDVPEGSIISMRAGQTRRQAPLSLDKAFRFDQPRSKATPMKIDIYAPIASTRLVVAPDEDSYSAHFESKDGSGMKLDFQVVDSVKDGKGADPKTNPIMIDQSPETAKESLAKKHIVALEAQSYLDEHNLFPIMQSLLQAVIKEKPDDPFHYMVNVLEGAKAGDRVATAPPRIEKVEGTTPTKQLAAPPSVTPAPFLHPPPPPPAVPPSASPPAPSEKPVEQPAAPSAQAPQEEHADIRDRARTTLAVAAESGDLGRALDEEFGLVMDEVVEEANAEAPKNESVKDKVSTALADAAETGDLEKALQEECGLVVNEVAKEAEAEVPKAKATEIPEEAPKEEEKQVERALPMPCPALPPPCPSAPPCPALPIPTEDAQPEVDIEKLTAARENLEKAAEDGSLLNLLSQTTQNTEEPKASQSSVIREKTKANLKKSAEDGVLWSALTEDSQTGMRQKTRESLEKAAEDGSLLSVLAQDNTDVREKTKASSEKAAEDGSLLSALTEDNTDVREKTKESFEKAAEDGSLLSAPTEDNTDVREQTKESLEKAAEDGSLLSVPTEGNHTDFREQTKESLEKAAEDGSLLSALTKNSQTDVREQAKESLEKAAEDGSLLSVLTGDATEGTAGATSEETAGLVSNVQDASQVISETAVTKAEPAAAPPPPATSEEPSYDELRAQARQCLSDAADSGTLLQALADCPALQDSPLEKISGDDDLNEVRTRACGVLTKAAETGNLEKILVTDSQDVNALDGIRQRARGSLEKAVADGNLLKMLTEDEGGHLPVDGNAVVKDDYLESTRSRARHSLEKAVESGDLAKALEIETMKMSDEAPAPTAPVQGATAKSLARKLSKDLSNAAKNDELSKALASQKAHPSSYLKRGDSVSYLGGTHEILDATTTDALLRLADGKEKWCGQEEVELLQACAHDLKLGDKASFCGKIGVIVDLTTTDVTLKMVDGSQKFCCREDLSLINTSGNTGSAPAAIPAAAPAPVEKILDPEEALKNANEVLKSFNDELRNDNVALENQAIETRNQIAAVQANAIMSLQSENAEQRKQIDHLSQQIEDLKLLMQVK